MLDKLSYMRKNKLLLPLAGLGIVLCWFLAFSKTFEAVRRNAQLSRQVQAGTDISFNPQHSRRKLDALEGILKSYQVREDGWSNELWMKASAIAVKQGVGIDYTMRAAWSVMAEKDTSAVGLSQVLYFYGDYTKLVRLVDTLERSRGIGKISALQIKAPKADVVGERAGRNVMKIEFRALTN